MNDRNHSHNGRVTPRADHSHEHAETAMRRRSPAVYWTAVIVAVAMGASAIGTFLYFVL